MTRLKLPANARAVTVSDDPAADARARRLQHRREYNRAYYKRVVGPKRKAARAARKAKR